MNINEFPVPTTNMQAPGTQSQSQLQYINKPFELTNSYIPRSQQPTVAPTPNNTDTVGDDDFNDYDTLKQSALRESQNKLNSTNNLDNYGSNADLNDDLNDGSNADLNADLNDGSNADLNDSSNAGLNDTTSVVPTIPSVDIEPKTMSANSYVPPTEIKSIIKNSQTNQNNEELMHTLKKTINKNNSNLFNFNSSKGSKKLDLKTNEISNNMTKDYAPEFAAPETATTEENNMQQNSPLIPIDKLSSARSKTRKRFLGRVPTPYYRTKSRQRRRQSKMMTIAPPVTLTSCKNGNAKCKLLQKTMKKRKLTNYMKNYILSTIENKSIYKDSEKYSLLSPLTTINNNNPSVLSEVIPINNNIIFDNSPKKTVTTGGASSNNKKIIKNIINSYSDAKNIAYKLL